MEELKLLITGPEALQALFTRGMSRYPITVYQIKLLKDNWSDVGVKTEIIRGETVLEILLPFDYRIRLVIFVKVYALPYEEVKELYDVLKPKELKRIAFNDLDKAIWVK